MTGGIGLVDPERIPARMCRFRLGRVGGPERIVGNAILRDKSGLDADMLSGAEFSFRTA